MKWIEFPMTLSLSLDMLLRKTCSTNCGGQRFNYVGVIGIDYLVFKDWFSFLYLTDNVLKPIESSLNQ